MKNDKQSILDNLCYTELVYGRINKKLKTNLSKLEIEQMLYKIIKETKESCFERMGKNMYITNNEYTIRITINMHTYRVITVDRI